MPVQPSNDTAYVMGNMAYKIQHKLDKCKKAINKTQCGTFKDGDLLVNKDGVRIVSQEPEEAAPPIKPTDDQLSLADMDIIKMIGKGCSGTVQLAITVNFQEDLVKHITQELKINQSAQCPYVAVCYQSFYDTGVISIILEYMDGGSLADFLKKVNTIPEPYLLQSVSRGEVKITDFGVSAMLTTTSAERNMFVGMYNYMSPERISGGTYGYKSDIWSLGIVLLECATVRFPYSALEEDEGWTNCYELMEPVVEQPPPFASSDQFSPEFCSFISAWSIASLQCMKTWMLILLITSLMQALRSPPFRHLFDFLSKSSRVSKK
ncbi:Mitogen-activated protein kinase kinase [Thalictrum thalictroides]|uniref:mitogen-activated protein kinase kinase n=1 Tax=Thalictrum thalictroides TaxID=46969 RepID=A0A7J6WQR7_THATH|nr:Mitogen-activated protein kinase kinase [Thalictrum thalictroides]